MPTEEEVSAIQEAQTVNPDIPLASAEQFLQMMASISGLKARLSLWLFKADYDNLEEVRSYEWEEVPGSVPGVRYKFVFHLSRGKE